MFALVVTRTYGGLRASCSCGEDLGESVTWKRSQAAHAEHVADDHASGSQAPVCICTPAIAGISDGPNVDCAEHGESSTQPNESGSV